MTDRRTAAGRAARPGVRGLVDEGDFDTFGA